MKRCRTKPALDFGPGRTAEQLHLRDGSVRTQNRRQSCRADGVEAIGCQRLHGIKILRGHFQKLQHPSKDSIATGIRFDSCRVLGAGRAEQPTACRWNLETTADRGPVEVRDVLIEWTIVELS